MAHVKTDHEYPWDTHAMHQLPAAMVGVAIVRPPELARLRGVRAVGSIAMTV